MRKAGESNKRERQQIPPDVTVGIDLPDYEAIANRLITASNALGQSMQLLRQKTKHQRKKRGSIASIFANGVSA